jgi:hypothetical protein
MGLAEQTVGERRTISPRTTALVEVGNTAGKNIFRSRNNRICFSPFSQTPEIVSRFVSLGYALNSTSGEISGTDSLTL